MIEAQDIKALKTEIETAFQNTKELNLVIEMTGWRDITEDAMREDMSLELKLLGRLGRVDRIAFVSDKNWVAAAVDFFGPWLPDTELCRFATLDAARNWAMHKADDA